MNALTQRIIEHLESGTPIERLVPAVARGPQPQRMRAELIVLARRYMRAGQSNTGVRCMMLVFLATAVKHPQLAMAPPKRALPSNGLSTPAAGGVKVSR